MERQKSHMASLEQEYAQVQDELAALNKTHLKKLQEKDADLLELKKKLERDTGVSSVAKEQLEALQAELEQLRSESGAQIEALTQNRDAQARELDQLRTQEDSAKASLKDKVEELEKRLHKQSRACSAAEEALEQARAQLEASVEQRSQSDIEVDNRELQAEVQKLEGMVRDRTEQLNKLRWHQEMAEKQPAGDQAEKMLVVLNQQLAASREDNQRLIAQVRELETQLAQAPASVDDLTRIRGVGPKLVAQLEELGITHFAQIAELNDQDLEDESHPLHSFRGRISKDEWITQAADLLS
jgi:predicted flap endonuclease-1-like 5' DNA nuclease